MQSTADSGRDDQARVLLATAGQWIKVRANDGRALAHGVPSASRLGVVHLANSTRCRAKTASGTTGAITAAPWRCTSRASALSRPEGGGSRRLLIGQTPAAAR